MVLLLLFYSVIILNLICVLFKFKSKIILFLTVLVCYLLFVGNTTDPDMQNYIVYYMNSTNFNSILSHPTEIGFYLLNLICNMLSMDVIAYKSVVFFICLLLIYSSLKYFNANYSAFCIFYLLGFFLVNIIQFRFFIASAIIIYGLRFLQSSNSGSTCKWIITVFVASSFHTIAILFIIFLVFKIKNKNIVIKCLLFISFSIFCLMFVLPKESLVSLLLNLFGSNDNRINMYFSNASMGMGFIFSYFIIIASMINIMYSKSLLKNSCLNLNIILFSLLPLYSLSIHFYRIPQVMYLCSSMIVSSDFNKLNFKKIRFYKLLFLLLLSLVLVNFINIYIIGIDYYYNEIINPIFFNNYFI